MVLLLGRSEDGRGQWEREGSSVGLWNERVPAKTIRGTRAVCLCMIQPFIICFSESWIRMFFQVSGGLFSESGGKLCRIEVRHFFPPKGGSRYTVYIYICNVQYTKREREREKTKRKTHTQLQHRKTTYLILALVHAPRSSDGFLPSSVSGRRLRGCLKQVHAESGAKQFVG